MKLRSLYLMFFALLPIASINAERPDQEKLNILFLYADDLGYGDLRCYNPESKIPTPNLDRLAAEGMRFTDGHSSSGVCTPSRYALLTGRYHWRKFYGIVKTFEESVFDAERLTLPEMLQESGYSTAAIGKWHLGWGWKEYLKPGAELIISADGRGRKTYAPDAFDWSKPIPDGPLAHGFDTYFGDTVINFPPYAWIQNDRVLQIPDRMLDTSAFKPIKEGRWECRQGPMVEGWDPYENIPETTRRGVEYIHQQAKHDKPFFLYFAFPSPHAPIIPNDRFDGSSDAGPYGDFVVETDDSCGQLIKALKESGQYENTIIFFSADNGAEAYAYARDKNFDHWSSQPLRGLKQDLYEGGHRVPFIIRWPGMVREGAVGRGIVSQIDLIATLASYLDYGLPKGQAEDSHDLTPLLKELGDSPRRAVVHSTWERMGFGYREGDWVLIDAATGYARKPTHGWEERYGFLADDDQPVELYNLREDIGQRFNLAKEYPEKVVELKKALELVRNHGHPELDRMDTAR
ncbi:MAG: arylsulfatase [Puniceicoccaceae bacterium]